VDNALRVIDIPLDRAYAGPCDECGSDVYATPGSLAAVCKVCAAFVDIAARQRRLLERMVFLTATADKAACLLAAVGVSVSGARIRMWHKRKKLPHVGVTAKGARKFRLGDIISVAAQTATPRAARTPKCDPGNS
jgi:hypothetical protein